MPLTLPYLATCVLFLCAVRSDSEIRSRSIEVRFKSDIVLYDVDHGCILVRLQNGFAVYLDSAGSVMDSIYTGSADKNGVTAFPKERRFVITHNSGLSNATVLSRLRNAVGSQSHAELISMENHSPVFEFEYKGDAYDVTLNGHGKMIVLTTAMLGKSYIQVFDLVTSTQLLNLTLPRFCGQLVKQWCQSFELDRAV